MSVNINTNQSSITAQKNLNAANAKLLQSVQRLSSGLRINSAKDDASGLNVAAVLTAKVKSITVASRNASDGISLAQTAEGGLDQAQKVLIRMRELAQQAANGGLSNDQYTALNNEYTQLSSEIDRISNVTEFNGIKLMNGSISTTGITLQVGFQNTVDDRITFFSGVAATNTTGLGITGQFAAISSVGNAQSALAQLDSAISTVAKNRGTLGAIQNRLDVTIANLTVTSENFTAGLSRIMDADYAYETAEYTKNQILVQAGIAVLGQANAEPQAASSLLR